MKYIKGVYRHGSETILTILKDEKKLNLNCILKTATTSVGIKSIHSEYEGLRWYNKRNKIQIKFELKKITKSYFVIELIPNNDFFNIESYKSYRKYAKYIDLTIKHYCQIWSDYSGQDYAPLHGDLSLVGNVMFNNQNQVLFVDWEHFNIVKKIPTGLDIIMMLVENLLYELKYNKIIKKDVYEHFANSIASLKNAKLLSPLLHNNPILNTQSFIKSNIDIWNGQYFKLPILKFPKKEIEKLYKSFE